MAADQNALKMFHIDARTFKEPKACFEVLEHILKPFNVTIKQHKGKYVIVCPVEINSDLWKYDWDTLTQQSKTANDLAVDIADKFVSQHIEHQKIAPFKVVRLTYLTETIYENVTSGDTNDWTMAWIKDVYNWSIHNGNVDLMLHSLRDPSFADDPGWVEPLDAMTLSSKFTFGTSNINQYIKVEFNYMTRVIMERYIPEEDTGYDGNAHAEHLIPVLLIEIQRPDGTWYIADSIVLIKTEIINWSTYTSPQTNAFMINAPGDYNVRFRLASTKKYWTWYELQFWIRYVLISGFVINEGEDDAAGIARDIEYYQYLAQYNHKEQKLVTVIGDAPALTHSGVLMLYDLETENFTVTQKKWNTVGREEQAYLLDLHCRMLLNNRAKYKNFLRANIHDRENTITFNNVLLIDGLYYAIVNYKRNYRLGTFECDLVELLTGQQSFNPAYVQELKTVQGSKI